jgi:hypothetical protein
LFRRLQESGKIRLDSPGGDDIAFLLVKMQPLGRCGGGLDRPACVPQDECKVDEGVTVLHEKVRTARE